MTTPHHPGERVLVEAEVQPDGLLALVRQAHEHKHIRRFFANEVIVHGTVTEHEQLRADVARLREGLVARGINPRNDPLIELTLLAFDNRVRDLDALRTERDDHATTITQLRAELEQAVATEIDARTIIVELRALTQQPTPPAENATDEPTPPNPNKGTTAKDLGPTATTTG